MKNKFLYYIYLLTAYPQDHHPILSLKDEYTFCFSNFLINGLYNSPANCYIWPETLRNNFTFNSTENVFRTSSRRLAKQKMFAGKLLNNPLASYFLIYLDFL